MLAIEVHALLKEDVWTWTWNRVWDVAFLKKLKVRVGQNRIRIYTAVYLLKPPYPYPNPYKWVYTGPYIYTAYKPYIYDFTVYIPYIYRICTWCAGFDSQQQQSLLLVLVKFFSRASSYWALPLLPFSIDVYLFTLIISFISGCGSYTPFCTEKGLFLVFLA